jgi:hypothetical protein
MDRVEIVALIGACAWLVIIFELIRRRRLSEGYALLWLLAGFVLLGLALWRRLLDVLAALLGIYYPPTALFVVAFLFVLFLLVQQSIVVCRLDRQNRDVAERLALLTVQMEHLTAATHSPAEEAGARHSTPEPAS